MSSTIYKNKTEYTRKLYKKIAVYKTFYSSKSILAFLAISVSCYTGAITINSDPLSKQGWFYLLLGFVIFPLLFFGIPYFLTMYGYKTIIKESNGKPFSVSVEITDKKISCRNSLGQLITLPYDKIEKVSVLSNLFVISGTGRNVIYVDCAEFNEDYHTVKDYIVSRMPNRNNED